MSDRELAKPSAAGIVADLTRYSTMAVELGASDAKPVEVSSIVFDARVRLKCQVPLCPSFNRCANCPPHLPSLTDSRTALVAYSWGLLVRLRGDLESISSEQARKAAYRQQTLLTKIVGDLEAHAFSDGHYMAMGLGAGSCLYSLCGGIECLVLQGKDCRHPFKSRPSMEALGIDVFATAAVAGWELLPAREGRDGSASRSETSAIGLLLLT